MEPKCELGAMRSSQDLGASSDSISIDRFSELPDEIAHRIISFHCGFLMNLIRIGAVSKRFRQLYLSLPLLIIVSGHVSNYTWSRRNDEFFRITTWIQNAVRCSIKVLHLEITENNLQTLVLPSCIFHCQSLTDLYVKLNGVNIHSTSLSISSNLQQLTLKDAMIEDERFFKWISVSCKCMTDLFLENVSGIKDVTIVSSSLEFTYLCPFGYDLQDLNISGEKIEDICILWEFDSSDESRCGFTPHIRSLNIVTPNLKKIKWGGTFLDHPHLGSLMYLEEAKICLSPHLGNFKNPFEFQCSIRMVKTLVLNEEATKALFVDGSMPLRFDNIDDLTLHVLNVDDDFVPAMVSLLRGITTLSSLSIITYLYKRALEELYNGTVEMDNEYEHSESEEENSESTEEDAATEEGDNASKFDVEYWKSQNLDFICELKEVKWRF